MRRSLAFIALAFATAAGAQTSASPSQQVQLVAPQLVPFAGSPGNFESLVNGLTTGVPVTLVTVGSDGTVQTVTFTPGTALTPGDAARLLEAARQSLIVRGIPAPTGQQLAAALLGGSVAAPSGNVTLTGVLTGSTLPPTPVQVRTDSAAPGAAPVSNISSAQLDAVRNALANGRGVTVTSGTGAAAQSVTFSATGRPLSDFEVNQTLQLAATLLAQQGIVNPTAEQLRAAIFGGTVRSANGGNIAIQGVLQGRVANTSDNPRIGTSTSTVLNTSDSPSSGTSNTPATGGGAPANPPTASTGATISAPRPTGGAVIGRGAR